MLRALLRGDMCHLVTHCVNHSMKYQVSINGQETMTNLPTYHKNHEVIK